MNLEIRQINEFVKDYDFRINRELIREKAGDSNTIDELLFKLSTHIKENEQCKRINLKKNIFLCVDEQVRPYCVEHIYSGGDYYCFKRNWNDVQARKLK